MSLTRADFMKGMAATLALGLAGPRAKGALQGMGCGTPEGFIAITEQADQGLAEMALLLTWKLSQAPTVVGLLAQAPGDPFAAARAQAMTVTSNWSTPSDFWNQLATAMICAAVAQIPDYGINAIADGGKSQALINSLMASPTASQEVGAVYGSRFMNTRPDPCGQPLSTYLPAQVQPTVAVAISDDYLAALDLKAVNDPAAARLEATLLLFKLQLAMQSPGVPDYRPQVISVWSARNPASPAYLATTASWPQTNYLTAAFSANNPLSDACRALTRIDRNTSDIQNRGQCQVLMQGAWHAEALAGFVNNQGAAAGLATGASWNRVDFTTTRMPGPGWGC